MTDPGRRRILDAGDSAFVLEFGDRIDPQLVAEVNALDHHIARLRSAGRLDGLIETVPTFRSLAVIFDPLVTTPDDILAVIDGASLQDSQQGDDGMQTWYLPVSYGGAGGPDLEQVAERLSLPIESVIEQHRNTSFQVYMLGFQPGFAFLGDLPETLHLPRLEQPRTRVPAGSVAIANRLTAVYPWESPGGWHLIGRCPIPLFDASWTSPTLLRAGDQVHFRAVDPPELAAVEAALAAGSFDLQSLHRPC